MLARWNGEGEFESIFKKKGVSVSDEANNIFGRIESLDEFNMPINAEEWDKWAKSIKLTDDSLKKFLTTKDEAYQTKDLATYTQYLKDQNKTLDIAAVKTKALAFAKNMAINAGIAFASFLVSKGIQALIDWANRAEIAREKSTELTKAWSEENSSIDSSISKYKQLKESLDSGTLSTQEIANAKNELAEIQDTLTSKYGQEALGIDLVNGKYDEQIKKLDELSRKKAEDYTAENYANIQEDIKYVNNSVKVDEELGSGAVFNPDTYNKYLKKYLDEYDALTTRVTDRNGIVGSSGLNIVGEGTREEIYNQLTSLFNDLSRDFGEDNPDVNKLKTALSGIISDSFDTEKMEQAKSNIKQYAEAQILSQNNTRQLYEDAINAVDNYNKALASGQGVEEAKANLDEVKQKVADNTSGISGAGQVFEDVWGGISEGAKTTSENVNKMTVSLSEMKSASDNISAISDAFKQLSDDGYMTTESISKIQEATGLSGAEWDNYESKLLKAKAGSAELNQVMSDLTYKILENTFSKKELADATEEEISVTEKKIATVLRENGVINANAVAHDYVKQAVLKAKLAKADFSNGVDAVVSSLYEEVKWLGLTEDEVSSLASAYSAAQGGMLDAATTAAASRLSIMESELKAITSVAEAYALLSKDGTVSYTREGSKNPLVGSELARLSEAEQRAHSADVDKVVAYGKAVETLNKIKNISTNFVKLGGGSKGSSGGGGSDSSSSYIDPTDAIINRINLRADELAQQEEAILNSRELAEAEENYEEQFSLTNDLIDTRKERIEELNIANEALHNEAEYLRNSNPWDEESWFDSLGNETEAYIRLCESASETERKQIEGLFSKLSAYKTAYKDNVSEIIGLNKDILNDEKHLLEILNSKMQERSDKIDDIQSAYDVLTKAVEEKNEHDAISVDTLQSLLQLEPQYLSMLSDENGQLILNEESINRCTAAYIDNLSAQSALNLIDMVSTLANEKEQLELLAGATDTATGSLWDLVNAKMAVMRFELSPEVFNALKTTVDATKSMGDNTKAGLSKGGLTGLTARSGGGGGGKSGNNTDYFSIVDAQIEDNNKILEGLEEQREEYNRNLEHELTMGNKEEAEIWRSKIAENAKNTKEILHSQNNTYRDKQKSLMEQLHEIVPDDLLKDDLSWGDITEVDIANIEHYFSGGSDDTNANKVSGIIDDLKALDSAIEENSESWRNMGETSKEVWASIIDYGDTSSRDWIAKQQAYNKLSEQEEINALQRMVENNRRYQQQILEDDSLTLKEKENLWRQAQDNIDSYNKDIYVKQKALDLKISETYISERNAHGDWSLYGDSEYKAWQRVIEWLREKYPEELDKIHEIEHKALDARYNYSKDWISERNANNDWRLFDDSEVDAWERVVRWIREEYPKDINKLKEAERSLFEARKKEFNNATKLGDSYINSQKKLLQSHYDVENSIAEARHEINKELETSKAMYEYLNKDTRKLLFNQEDFNKLCAELNKIEYQALKLQSEYENKLRGATLQTIESITSEYEMQYETLMKSYEIAKADLEIAKKKQQLNNVLNERNVRMFIDGRWQWVANTNDVTKAKSELADAEYAKQVEEAGLTQKKSIDDLTRQQNNLNLAIKNFEGGVITLNSAVTNAAIAISRIPQAMSDMLKQATEHSETYFVKGTVHESPTSEIMGDYVAVYTTSPDDIKNGFATGTSKTPSGWALLGENESEVFINSNGRLVPINQPTIGNLSSGGMVFNQEQMLNLRDWWDLSNIPIVSSNFINKNIGANESFVFSGDIIVNNPANAEDVANNVVHHIVQGLKLQRKSR